MPHIWYTVTPVRGSLVYGFPFGDLLAGSEFIHWVIVWFLSLIDHGYQRVFH